MSSLLSPARGPASKYEGLLGLFYEADHTWRDYKGQAAFAASLLAARKRPLVADLCCGAGAHSLRLARSGLRVVGVDRSKTLLEQARCKLRGARLPVRFVKEDVFSFGRKPSFRGRFDAATLLGSTLSMIPIFSRFPELLAAAHAALKPGGLFIFDAVMGDNYKDNPEEGLFYRLPSGVSGRLKVSQLKSRDGRTCTCLYDWRITPQDGERPLSLKARESLRILSLEDLLGPVRAFGRFEIVEALRDYRLGARFREGDRNCVMVLKKAV